MQHPVDHLLERLAHAEESVVQLGVSGRVDPAEVIHALVLGHCVCNQCPELEKAATLECLQQLSVLVQIRERFDNILNELVILCSYSTGKDGSGQDLLCKF